MCTRRSGLMGRRCKGCRSSTTALESFRHNREDRKRHSRSCDCVYAGFLCRSGIPKANPPPGRTFFRACAAGSSITLKKTCFYVRNRILRIHCIFWNCNLRFCFSLIRQSNNLCCFISRHTEDSCHYGCTLNCIICF